MKTIKYSDAVRLCPTLVMVKGEDLTNYRTMSDKVTELLQSNFTSKVERLGMDENFVDVTDLVKNHSPVQEHQVEGHVYHCEPSEDFEELCACGCDERVKIGSQIAANMRRAIFEELGLTTCAGISYNKVLAKLVGSQHKPNQQTTLFSWQAMHLICSLQGKNYIFKFVIFQLVIF
jgi:DNA polymerase iota